MSWTNPLKSEIKSINTSRNEWVKFGLTVGAIFVVLGLIFQNYLTAFLTIGGFLVISGLFFPKALKYPYLAWMALAVIGGFIVFRIFLVVLYFIAIIPIGFLSRIFRGGFFNKKFPGIYSQTYWLKRQSQSSPDNPY